MKEFDLEAAKAGKTVCTRDGKPVRIICCDRKCSTDTPIVALIGYNQGNQEDASVFRTDGRYGRSDYDEPHPNDLMMKGEKFEGWVSVYRKNNGLIKVDNRVFATKEESLKMHYRDLFLVDTIHIEWEE